MNKNERKKYNKKYYNKNKNKYSDNYKKYRKTKTGKIARKRAMDKYRKTDKYKLLQILHRQINNLKNQNNLIMENCAICNKLFTEFHHPNNKLPLHVYFLCKECHYEQHKKT